MFRGMGKQPSKCSGREQRRNGEADAPTAVLVKQNPWALQQKPSKAVLSAGMPIRQNCTNHQPRQTEESCVAAQQCMRAADEAASNLSACHLRPAISMLCLHTIAFYSEGVVKRGPSTSDTTVACRNTALGAVCRHGPRGQHQNTRSRPEADKSGTSTAGCKGCNHAMPHAPQKPVQRLQTQPTAPPPSTHAIPASN
jgi:hypothetical protein